MSPRPLADCHVYCFWATGSGANRTFKHFGDSPAKTDANGVCSYAFKKDATCFVYFAGKKLAAEEVKQLGEKRSEHLLLLQIDGNQPSTSRFKAKEIGDQLQCELSYSLPLYISRLQRIEEKLTVPPKDMLTKVRKLSYDDSRWDTLIPRGDIAPLFKYDKGNGKIAAAEVPVPMAEALANIYERETNSNGEVIPNQFRLHGTNKYRKKLEIFDYVSTPDGSFVQMGHVLTGIESRMFSNAPDTSVAMATWAGDLGQAAWLVAKEAFPDPPNSQQWTKVWKTKARYAEMVGDIVGASQSKKAAALLKGSASLSSVLEDLFVDDWRKANVKAFAQEYKIDSIQTPNPASVEFVGDLVNKSAALFSKGLWIPVPASVKDPSLGYARAHLFAVLIMMDQAAPIPTPDPT